MDQLWTAIITTACTVLASLLVTFIFNKVSGIPQQMKKEKAAHKAEVESLKTTINNLETRLTAAEGAIAQYPAYREQSLQIQSSLREADKAIVELCKEIKEDVQANREMLDERLSSLEIRERNALRAEILKEYRLYTDKRKNPMLAWTSMEHHSFSKLVEDYESLGGNEYVHHTILPAMDKLEIISMDDLDAVKDLYDSRTVDSTGQV
jgi:hypothetical protein